MNRLLSAAASLLILAVSTPALTLRGIPDGGRMFLGEPVEAVRLTFEAPDVLVGEVELKNFSRFPGSQARIARYRFEGAHLESGTVQVNTPDGLVASVGTLGETATPGLGRPSFLVIPTPGVLLDTRDGVLQLQVVAESYQLVSGSLAEGGIPSWYQLRGAPELGFDGEALTLNLFGSGCLSGGLPLNNCKAIGGADATFTIPATLTAGQLWVHTADGSSVAVASVRPEPRGPVIELVEGVRLHLADGVPGLEIPSVR